MDKVTEVNIEGKDYGFVAGQTVKGVSGALSSDYVKHVILPEGAEVVEGMLIAVTFVNDNTAGYSGEKTVYSTDGINFYWDSGYTQLITLPPQGCYKVTATETQYEYKLSEYPVLVMGDMTKPFCDSRGHPAGGKLWGAGDTVTVINLENRFIALQTTVNEIIQGSSLPVTSGAVYEKCNSLEPVNEVTSGNLHSVTSNAVAESIKNMTYLFPIRLEKAITSSASWQRFLWQGIGFLDKYAACPNISGKTKKVRLVMSIMTDSDNTISVLLKRRDDVEQVIVDNVVVWGGVAGDAFVRLVYSPIDPSFLGAYTIYYLKSSKEGYNVAVGYVFAEVYYE